MFEISDLIFETRATVVNLCYSEFMWDNEIQGRRIDIHIVSKIGSQILCAREWSWSVCAVFCVIEAGKTLLTISVPMRECHT